MPQTERGRLVVLLGVWVLTMALALGNTSLWEPDEPRFAESTRLMIERGDFITPWFNDRPRFEKPVLMYWLQVPFVTLLGPTEAAFRIPSALAGLLTILIVYSIASRLVSPRAGFVGAVVLATTFRFVLYARQGLTDVPVTAFVAASIWAFLRAFDEQTFDDGATRRSRRFALLAWAATGCAALTKGPVAVIGPLVWFIFAAPDGWRAAVRRMHVPLGIVIAAAIALPWHIAMYGMHGRPFLEIELGYEVVARYTSPDFPGRDRGFFYFYGVWLGDAAPWSLFFIAGAIWAAVAWRQLDDRMRAAVRLSVVWFLVVLVLFSFSSYKLPHYIMPAFPATALLVGVFADALLSGSVTTRLFWRIPAGLTAALLFAGAVLLGLLLRRAFGLAPADPSFVLPAILAAGALWTTASILRRRDAHVLTALLATLVAGYAWAILVVSPRELRRFQPIPGLGRSVQRISEPGEPLAVAGNYGAPGLVFYARRHVEQLVDREDLVRYLSEPGPRHCVLPLTDFEEVRPALSRSWRIVDQGDVFSVRMRRLLERAPERAGRTLVLVTSK